MIFSNKLKNPLHLKLLVFGDLVLNSSVLSQQFPMRVQVDPKGNTYETTEEIQDGSYGNAPRRVKVVRHDNLVGAMIESKFVAGSSINIKYIKGIVNLGNKLTSTPVGIKKLPEFYPPVEDGDLGALYGVWARLESDFTYTKEVFNFNYDSAFLIGNQKMIKVPENRYLFLFVNDDNYNDNSGFYEVEITTGEVAAKEDLSQRNKDLSQRNNEFYSQGKIDMESAPWQTSGSFVNPDGKSGNFDLKTALKTGFQVKKGETLIITAIGKIKVGDFAGTSTPRGISGYQEYNFFMNFTHASLLVGIAGAKFDNYVKGLGYRNSVWTECGESCKFVAEQDGEVWLLVNDKGFSNNSGSYKVTVNKQGGSVPVNKNLNNAPQNTDVNNQPSPKPSQINKTTAPANTVNNPKPFMDVTITLEINSDGSGLLMTRAIAPVGSMSRAACEKPEYIGTTREGWKISSQGFWKNNRCESLITRDFTDLKMLNEQFSLDKNQLQGDIVNKQLIQNKNQILIKIHQIANLSPMDFKQRGFKEVYFKRTFIVKLPKIISYTESEISNFNDTSNTVSWTLPSNENKFDYLMEVTGLLNELPSDSPNNASKDTRESEATKKTDSLPNETKKDSNIKKKIKKEAKSIWDKIKNPNKE